MYGPNSINPYNPMASLPSPAMLSNMLNGYSGSMYANNNNFATLPAPTWGVNWQPYVNPMAANTNAVIVPLILPQQDVFNLVNRSNTSPATVPTTPEIASIVEPKPVIAESSSSKPATQSLEEMLRTIQAQQPSKTTPKPTDNYDQLGELVADIARTQADKNPRIKDIVEGNLIPKLIELQENPDQFENIAENTVKNSWMGKLMRWTPQFVRNGVERFALWLSPNKTDPYISWLFDNFRNSPRIEDMDF